MKHARDYTSWATSLYRPRRHSQTLNPPKSESFLKRSVKCDKSLPPRSASGENTAESQSQAFISSTSADNSFFFYLSIVIWDHLRHPRASGKVAPTELKPEHQTDPYAWRLHRA
ncbi:hypothetical protein FNYG_10191 [Fusarium nygamai]|uniref:Uncharacterized protein n=1 Tax=Gibberella nygamai TaxID=42673 RepID=A0A2K0W2G9_GIBNY|nr:hypothetical protein FNYG_10191 [Fusarium nygamai]